MFAFFVASFYVFILFMKCFKIILIALVVLCVVTLALVYGYIQSLPTGAPQFVDVADLDKRRASSAFSCQKEQSLQAAFDVQAEVVAKVEGQLIYQSSIRFKTQLQQVNDDVVQGLASHISIDEGQGETSIRDVTFLSRAEAGRYLVFNAFNDLGLHAQHPMLVLSQLLKALSVGEEDQAYFFSYDPLQRTYQYMHSGSDVARASWTSTANLKQLQGLFNDYKNQWQVVLGDDCLPQSMQTSESQGLMVAGKGGYIAFKLKANRIDTEADLSGYDFSLLANGNNTWQTQQIKDSSLEAEVINDEQMLSILAGFSSSKSTAKLARAAQYLIDHWPAEQTAELLLGDQLSDTAKRDLAFGLSISQSEAAESYIMDVVHALPNDKAVDLHKVRLLVALSGNALASEQAYSFMSGLYENPHETDNVRNNALINMGAVVEQLQRQQVDTYLRNELSGYLQQQLNENSHISSAILAAGNAHIADLDMEIIQRLTASSSKERYAAGMVLARNPAHYSLVIQHLKGESSNLVSHAILASMQASALDEAQVQQLRDIQAQSTGDKAAIIQNFLQQY